MDSNSKAMCGIALDVEVPASVEEYEILAFHVNFPQVSAVWYCRSTWKAPAVNAYAQRAASAHHQRDQIAHLRAVER